jgi:hypothetical protein
MAQVKSNFQIIAATVSTLYFGLFVLSLLLVPFAIWGVYSPVLESSGQPAT